MTLPDATAATTSAPDADQERWNAYWSRWAAEYDDHQLTRLAQPGERETWTRIWESALPSSAREVLDVGTGSGTVALLVAATGRDVTGIDLAGGMLERARAKAADHPHPPRFLPGDAVAPPFAPGTICCARAARSPRSMHAGSRPTGPSRRRPSAKPTSPPRTTRTPSPGSASAPRTSSGSVPTGRPQHSRTCR